MEVVEAVPVVSLIADDLETRYALALALVQEIDRRLEGGQHFRDREGRVLCRLDEVMLAIDEKRWPVSPNPF